MLLLSLPGYLGRRSTRRRLMALAGAAGVSLAWAGSARAVTATPVAGDDAILVPVDLRDFAIESGQVRFRTGQPYRFAVHNEGVILHEWLIEAAGAENEPLIHDGPDGAVISELEGIMPGTGQDLTWTFDEPGAYRMACHIPGHAEAGMIIPIEVLPEAQIVDVTASEFHFDLSAASVRAGMPVAFVVANMGKIEHEFVVEPAGTIDEPFEIGGEGEDGGEVSEIEDIEPGTRRELIWTFDDPGTIRLACHIAGHMEAGMVAALDVTR
jgi:uncharacterized cupredoxin-like copper-binding protein